MVHVGVCWANLLLRPQWCREAATAAKISQATKLKLTPSLHHDNSLTPGRSRLFPQFRNEGKRQDMAGHCFFSAVVAVCKMDATYFTTWHPLLLDGILWGSNSFLQLWQQGLGVAECTRSLKKPNELMMHWLPSYIDIWSVPVVPHEAVPEVSKK